MENKPKTLEELIETIDALIKSYSFEQSESLMLIVHDEEFTACALHGRGKDLTHAMVQMMLQNEDMRVISRAANEAYVDICCSSMDKILQSEDEMPEPKDKKKFQKSKKVMS